MRYNTYTGDGSNEFQIDGFGRMDGFDKKLGIIHELKPNNSWSIRGGNKQLERYAKGVTQAGLVASIDKLIKVLVKYN